MLCVQVTHQRIEITSDIPDDEETAVIVQSFTEELENTLSENAGPCATALDGRFKVQHPLFLFRASVHVLSTCLLYTSPSPRDRQKSRMPSSA